MNLILDILIPRIITEEVALYYDEDGNLNVLCALADINDDDQYDAVGTAKSFNFFGFGLFAAITNIRHI